MEKFIEACIVLILILLMYNIFKTEKFIDTVSHAISSMEFNFKNDAKGYSEADKYLKNYLNNK